MDSHHEGQGRDHETTTIIKRLVGIEALKTGANALVKIGTSKRSDVSIPAGCIMNPMLATDAEMWVGFYSPVASMAFI